jgi:hypothetical protein
MNNNDFDLIFLGKYPYRHKKGKVQKHDNRSGEWVDCDIRKIVDAGYRKYLDRRIKNESK